ncbi:MAG: ATP-binding protein [Pseudomonadota bacterium]
MSSNTPRHFADIVTLDDFRARRTTPTLQPTFAPKGLVTPQESARIAFQEAGIPARFHERVEWREWGNDQQREQQRRVLEVMREFAEDLPKMLDSGQCLLLTGGTGTGKTHLACRIARHCILPHRRSAMYITAMDAVRRFRDSWSTDESEGQVLRKFVEREMLVLDEVGVQRATDDERLMLCEIIDARYRERRSTIVASNYPLADLATYLTDRGVSRLLENGASIPFAWSDYRRK